MGHKIGDAVRLRPGSDYLDVLEPWAELTGIVAAVDDEGETIRVHYPEPFPGYTSALPAAEFVPDAALAEAPF